MLKPLPILDFALHHWKELKNITRIKKSKLLDDFSSTFQQIFRFGITIPFFLLFPFEIWQDVVGRACEHALQVSEFFLRSEPEI